MPDRAYGPAYSRGREDEGERNADRHREVVQHHERLRLYRPGRWRQGRVRAHLGGGAFRPDRPRRQPEGGLRAAGWTRWPTDGRRSDAALTTPGAARGTPTALLPRGRVQSQPFTPGAHSSYHARALRMRVTGYCFAC